MLLLRVSSSMLKRVQKLNAIALSLSLGYVLSMFLTSGSKENSQCRPSLCAGERKVGVGETVTLVTLSLSARIFQAMFRPIKVIGKKRIVLPWFPLVIFRHQTSLYPVIRGNEAKFCVTWHTVLCFVFKSHP